jgi:hypothetical protein
LTLSSFRCFIALDARVKCAHADCAPSLIFTRFFSIPFSVFQQFLLKYVFFGMPNAAKLETDADFILKEAQYLPLHSKRMETIVHFLR